LMKQVSKCEPRMWGTSIVGFGTYRCTYADGSQADWPMTGFSPRKQSLVLYIVPSFLKHDDLMKNFGKHSTGKSCLYIKRLSDIDMPTLKKLVEGSFKRMKKKYS
jgi:hypothetical protein